MSDNTTATNATLSTSSPDPATRDCVWYLLLVPCVLVGVCCVVGLVANTLSMVVWGRRRTTPTSILLQALAAADMLVLGTSGIYRVVTQTCFLEQNSVSCQSWYIQLLYPFLVKYLWPVGAIAHSCAVWLTVLLAVNRYVAVCHPLHAHRLIRKSYVIAQVVCVFVTSSFYCLPRFFEINIAASSDANPNRTIYTPVFSDLFRDRNYQLWYRNVSFFLLMTLVPLMFLVGFTQRLIVAVQRAKKQRVRMVCSRQLSTKSQRDQREDTTLTVTLITVVLVFIVCQLPTAINRIFYVIHGGKLICGQFFFYFSYWSDLMNFINASVNFFVYCVCSSRFRDDFRHHFRSNRTRAASPNITDVCTIR